MPPAYAQLTQIEAEIAQATVKRSTAAQVQGVWGEVLAAWKDWSEQRTDALGVLMQEVVVTQKDRGHLRLSPIASVHGQLLAISSQMGAGRSLNANPPMVFPVLRGQTPLLTIGKAASVWAAL